MPLPLHLLALAVFAMGTSEFMLAGLVSDIAGDLHISLAQGGSLTAAFAVGMVVGAPAMAALARSWPRRVSMTSFLVVFVAVHLVGAVTEHFPVLFTTRVVAAVANAVPAIVGVVHGVPPGTAAGRGTPHLPSSREHCPSPSAAP